MTLPRSVPHTAVFVLLALAVAIPMIAGPADQPAARTDDASMSAHQRLVEKARRGGIDIYFEGDSITRRWAATDYPDRLANWNKNFAGWRVSDFGWGADKIENMLWRLDHGELDGVNPKLIVILAGTNNVGTTPGGDERVVDVTRGIRALIDRCLAKAPKATIVLTAIFPRNDSPYANPLIEKINARIATFADGKQIRFLSINQKLADEKGVLFEGMAADKLHPTVKAYQIWADALKPIFTEVVGPPADIPAAP